MGRARVTAASAKPKPKPRPYPKPRAKPRTKPSFLSPPSPASGGAGGESSGSGSASPSPSTASPVDLCFLSSASPKTKSRLRARPRAASHPLLSPRAEAAASPLAPTPAPAAAVYTVGELMGFAASEVESLKRRLDGLHSRAHADFDASLSRVSKRFKIQNQACQHLTDEVDKEHKKISESIKESADMIKASYKQIIAEAQSCTSHVCKVTIPEMAKSVEKAIENLRNRHNIPMTPA